MRKTLLFTLIIFSAIQLVQAQGIKTVSLKQEHMSYVLASFHITDVVDDRTDKAIVGRINGEKIDLQNGALASIKNYIAKNVTQGPSSQPIVLHIKKLYFDIRKSGAGWKGISEVVFSFYVGDRELTTLTGKGEQEMNNEPLAFVDEFIKKALESDFQRFDTWWAQNRGKIPTAATVRVIVKMGLSVNKPDCIIFSGARPLYISDFQGDLPPGIGVEHAATLSGVGFETSGETQNGQIVLTVTLTPYFNKAGSWFKKFGEHQNEILAHEQAHFNITALKTCELANMIRSTTFSKDTYEKQLEDMMHQNTDETNKEQELFDNETNHGTIRDKEIAWESKVKQMLYTAGCY